MSVSKMKKRESEIVKYEVDCCLLDGEELDSTYFWGEENFYTSKGKEE